MPTLVRLLTILSLAAGAVFAAMAGLVFFVEPTTRPVTVEILIPPRPVTVAPPPEAEAPEPDAVETGPFEAQAMPAPSGTPPVDPSVTGGTLRP